MSRINGRLYPFDAVLFAAPGIKASVPWAYLRTSVEEIGNVEAPPSPFRWQSLFRQACELPYKDAPAAFAITAEKMGAEFSRVVHGDSHDLFMVHNRVPKQSDFLDKRHVVVLSQNKKRHIALARTQHERYNQHAMEA